MRAGRAKWRYVPAALTGKQFLTLFCS